MYYFASFKTLFIILNILSLEPFRVFYHIFSSRGANSDCIIPTNSSTQCLFPHMICFHYKFTCNKVFSVGYFVCPGSQKCPRERFCYLFLSEPWGSLTGPRTVLIIQVGVPVSQIVFTYIFWTFCCDSSLGVLISHRWLSFSCSLLWGSWQSSLCTMVWCLS